MAEIVTRSAPQVGAQSYVEWGAVFAGASVALAASLVLLTFGAAIGLSSVSPYTSTATGLKAVGVGRHSGCCCHDLVFCARRLSGGTNAPPLERRLPLEVKFRNSAHGLLVWAIGILGAAVLATAGVSAIGKTLGAAVGSAAATSDLATVATDELFRTTNTTQAPSTAETRAEVTRLLLSSVGRGEISAADRIYLAQLVASRTGLSQTDAEKRVNDTIEKMKAAAERARKLGIVLGFLTASILLIGGASAWWAAAVGGRHRDEGTVWHGFSEIKGF